MGDSNKRSIQRLNSKLSLERPMTDLNFQSSRTSSKTSSFFENLLCFSKKSKLANEKKASEELDFNYST